MSLPYEQARALVAARQFLVDLCFPHKTPRIPKSIRQEASNRLKHFPLSWDWEQVVDDQAAMKTAREMEDHYLKTFWK
jgi:hypothetical protein